MKTISLNTSHSQYANCIKTLQILRETLDSADQFPLSEEGITYYLIDLLKIKITSKEIKNILQVATELLWSDRHLYRLIRKIYTVQDHIPVILN